MTFLLPYTLDTSTKYLEESVDLIHNMQTIYPPILGSKFNLPIQNKHVVTIVAHVFLVDFLVR